MLGLPERTLQSPSVQRRLKGLRAVGYNFDPDAEHPAQDGWKHDDRSIALPAEPPGPPLPDGAFEVAKRLMWGYEFADPSIVHAFYDPAEPLLGRTMLLQLRFHGLLRFNSGTRVAVIFDERCERDGRQAQVWGWAYRTLEGHLEQGQMDWQVWKWLDTGELKFRIRSYSRGSPGRGFIIDLGFKLFGRREQNTFLNSTLERMARLTEAALRGEGSAELKETAERLTARSGRSTNASNARLADRV